MNREWLQQHRLSLAWGVVALLVALLALREGIAYWREQAQWRALAESLTAQAQQPALTLEGLHQSAQARHIELVEVQPEDEGWLARGKVADAQALQGWLQALRDDGARPLQWGLERDTEGLRFTVRLRP